MAPALDHPPAGEGANVGAAVACAGGGGVTADMGDPWPRCRFRQDPRGVRLLKPGPHRAPQVAARAGNTGIRTCQTDVLWAGPRSLDKHMPQLFVSLPNPLRRGAKRGAQMLKGAPPPQKAPRSQAGLAE